MSCHMPFIRTGYNVHSHAISHNTSYCRTLISLSDITFIHTIPYDR